MSLCVLSCHYGQTGRAKLLVESCEYFGLPLVFCGKGGWPGSFRVGKMIGAAETIPKLKDYYSHVLWSDGFDSVVRSPAGEIQRRFQELGSPIVFSVETNCYPDPTMEALYPPNHWEPDWRFLNAGGWIGEIGEVERLIQVAIKHTPDPAPARDSDQYVWSRALLDGLLPTVALDYTSSIFRTMWRQKTHDCLPEKDMGNTCVVHYNGASNMDGYRRMAAFWESIKDTPEIP